MLSQWLLNLENKIKYSFQNEGSDQPGETIAMTQSQENNKESLSPCINRLQTLPNEQSSRDDAILSDCTKADVSAKISAEDIASRLFTFMDDNKTTEKKSSEPFVLNSFAKFIENQPSQFKKNAINGDLVKMIEQSRQKREIFLKKISQNPSPKPENSYIKLNKMNKSKTPKNLPNLERLSIQDHRSRSKTPRFQYRESKLSSRDRQEQPLFRAKSNLENQFKKQSKNAREKIQKQNQYRNDDKLNKKMQLSEHSQNKSEESINVKSLIQKKRQLQKQLIAINESLLLKRRKKSYLDKKCGKGRQQDKPLQKKRKRKSIINLKA